MTVGMKMTLILGAVVSFSLASWGLREILAGGLDPIFKGLGA